MRYLTNHKISNSRDTGANVWISDILQCKFKFSLETMLVYAISDTLQNTVIVKINDT